MSEEEMKKFADQYVPVLDPEFVKVVANIHNDVIAFVVAMPDMSAGIQKAKGKLFPFGFIYVLNSMRKSKQLNLMLGAVKNGHRGNGISAMMGKAMIESANNRGLKIMDSHLILEHNYSMRGECEKLNGTVCKRFRIFSKTLL
jgi:predicted GNAT family acetyltransferase